MKIKWENKINTIMAVIFFFGFLIMSYKYINLRNAYNKAESDKVFYCKEYYKIKCDEN